MNHLYVASPLSQVLRARAAAEALRLAAFRVTSRWHDVVEEGSVDPSSHEERRRVYLENRGDILAAQGVLALVDQGTPRGTYGEIGYALALDMPVVWVIGPKREGEMIFTADPRSHVTSSLDEALDRLRELRNHLG